MTQVLLAAPAGLKPDVRIARVLIVLIALALAGPIEQCGGDEPLSHARGDEPPYDPIEMYAEQSVEGWKVLVNRRLLMEDQRALRERTIKVLAEHLFRISRVIPAVSLEKLREVPIWIEQSHPRHPCMCYHVSPDWLLEHDMNPQKAGAVEIANCANFLTWTIDQPWMVLHELAHAFHHRVVGHNHADLKEMYRNAFESKTYDSVLHIRGPDHMAIRCMALHRTSHCDLLNHIPSPLPSRRREVTLILPLATRGEGVG